MSICSTGASDWEGARTSADQVLNLHQFAALAGISIATLRRLIKAGKGPTVTWLSARRCGVRLKHGRAWLDARAVPEAA
jgi:predicted DNA-binding transcriptional regulator AlpA